MFNEHCNLGAHATIDEINIAALIFFKEKRCACIGHICIYLLCICDTTFHVEWVMGICYQWNTIALAMSLEKFTYKMI